MALAYSTAVVRVRFGSDSRASSALALADSRLDIDLAVLLASRIEPA